jgi:hypothetical protein
MTEIKRRDATGHLNPEYEKKLLESSRENKTDDGNDKAFLNMPRTGEPIAEDMGEAFLEAATSGEDTEPDRHDQVTEEERGGPFITTTAGEEFAGGTDESNIAEATREPFPTTSKTD